MTIAWDGGLISTNQIRVQLQMAAPSLTEFQQDMAVYFTDGTGLRH